MSSRGFIELLAISQRGNAANLLNRAITDLQWSGVACRIGKYYVVVPMGEVSEVVNVPALTPVPKVKSWFPGVGKPLASIHRRADATRTRHLEPSLLEQKNQRVIAHHD